MGVHQRDNRSRTKREKVAQMLEQAIFRGDLPPGAKLVELSLSNRFGVSQACIRESLQQLEGTGLIVKYPNRGSYVTQINLEDLVHINQVRRQLEPVACALATTHMKESHFDGIQAALAEMRSAWGHRDYLAYSHADFRFHCMIWKAQPNRYLERCLKNTCLLLFAGDVIRRASDPALRLDNAIRQHELIATVLRAGDPERTERVVRRFLDRALRQDLRDYARIIKPSTVADGRTGTQSAKEPGEAPSPTRATVLE